jgi:hypothetical protein
MSFRRVRSPLAPKITTWSGESGDDGDEEDEEEVDIGDSA